MKSQYIGSFSTKLPFDKIQSQNFLTLALAPCAPSPGISVACLWYAWPGFDTGHSTTNSGPQHVALEASPWDPGESNLAAIEKQRRRKANSCRGADPALAHPYAVEIYRGNPTKLEMLGSVLLIQWCKCRTHPSCTSSTMTVTGLTLACPCAMLA